MRRSAQKPAPKSQGVKKPQKTAGGKPKVFFDEAEIRRRVRQLATQINRDYQGRTLHVVAVQENSFVFTADLIRALKVPVYCTFVRADIRDSAMGATATREITYTPSVDAAGKDILLIEGILQSGMTMDHLLRYLLGQNPASIKTAALVEKTDERKVDVPTDYVGFKASGRYLVGYGLGYQGQYKNLPFIAALP